MQEELALRVNKHDIILIVFTVIIAVLLMVLFNLYLYKGVATGVEIHYDGKLLESYSFDKLPKEKTLEINTDIGYNIINICNNKVSVTNSSCNDKVCNGFYISKPNQVIVCLPNKLVIKLVGASEVDSISY